MSDAYIGEIRTVGFNFPPVDWLTCDGSLQQISQYETLYALLGTTYGGDGQNTFGLPDFRSRIPAHQGNNGGSTFALGQMIGNETVTLNTTQLPVHSHPFASATALGSGGQPGPAGAYPAPDFNPSAGTYSNDTAPGNFAPLSPGGIGAQGGSQPHNNLMPILCVNFIICANGIYPSAS